MFVSGSNGFCWHVTQMCTDTHTHVILVYRYSTGGRELSISSETRSSLECSLLIPPSSAASGKWLIGSYVCACIPECKRRWAWYIVLNVAIRFLSSLDMTHCSSHIGSNSTLIEHWGLGKQSVEEPHTLLLYKYGCALDSCCMTSNLRYTDQYTE